MQKRAFALRGLATCRNLTVGRALTNGRAWRVF